MATTLTVQFADSTQDVIVTYFGCPQNPDGTENLGTVASDDSRWKTFYNQMAALGLSPGLPAPTTD